MAVVVWGRLLWRARGLVACSPTGPAAASVLWSAFQSQRSQSTSLQTGYVPKTSLSAPPWTEVKLPDPTEEAEQHAEVVQKINNLIAAGQYGRLFAIVHFASRQWKVTSEDLILIQNFVDAECGDRIRLEKVLLVGSDDFTLIGKPLLGLDLVRIEATIIEKTDSSPKIWMKFWRRHRYRRQKILVHPQTLLRINSIEIAPNLS
ncbi:large ribosomal subunit protein bL21m [Microcaecilia unicolor]|uniref:Large ribosomal subunit protein bL21m n=1 Tax=Microcaecilia unicolor TaxID=1415580 RepID=A0A6P7XXD5_9AMPH|nr:39S ribosomal protein L21, mitochondrial [Microcaecilia unicolor]